MKAKLKTKEEVIDKFDGKYAFLSNFFPNPELWETNEHFFQAMKCEKIEDAEHVFNAIAPNIAKKRGRQYKKREDWDDIKDYVMIIGLWDKFSKNEELKQKLLNTGNAELIEGNYWHDNYWGICNCNNCEATRELGNKYDLKSSFEYNKLGQLLMIVRDILRRLENIKLYLYKEKK